MIKKILTHSVTWPTLNSKCLICERLIHFQLPIQTQAHAMVKYIIIYLVLREGRERCEKMPRLYYKRSSGSSPGI